VPIILEEDIPHAYSNLFVHELLKKELNSQTVSSYATAIKMFLNWCYDEDIDYLRSPTRLRSPLLRYSRHLHDKQTQGELKGTYIKEILYKLVRFYRFLADDCNVRFDSCPWLADQIKTLSIVVGDRAILTEKMSSELLSTVKGASRRTPSTNTFMGYLNDSGERLRPLSDNEISILIKALYAIGNIEMTLAHLIILTSGARTQTIFTLRKCHFMADVNDVESDIVIPAGLGTLIDSKKGRPFNIYLPKEIYLSIQSYIASDRAQRRYLKANNHFEDEFHQYVFLTQFGNPFYISQTDPHYFQFDSPPKGQALTTFVNGVLKPMLADFGYENPFSRYKFHNLRASYGLKRLDSILAAMPADISELDKGIYLDRAISFVQKLMNHASRETTLHYLNLRTHTKLVSQADSHWSKYLASLAKDISS
jgi:integrase